MKNVVAYCRVSTDAQAQDDKYGIDAQKEAIMAYCAENDMQISAWYIDKGESGVKESRPQLNELLYGEIQNPPIEAVIVYKSDRIARDIRLYFYYMMLLEKRCISLISATEAYVDDGTGLGNVYRALMLFVAEQERKNIMLRTSNGRDIKSSRGGFSHGRPALGYKVVNGTLEIVEEEAEIVREIFALKRAGNRIATICRILNEEGRKTKSGYKFCFTTVKAIIERENLYRGMHKHIKSGEWIAGQHEAILKSDE